MGAAFYMPVFNFFFNPQLYINNFFLLFQVSYNVNGWLEKNKDPINMSVAALFKASKGNALLSYLFQDIGVEESEPTLFNSKI